MRKSLNISSAALAILMSISVAKADANYEEMFFGKENLNLTEKEFEALQDQQAWENSGSRSIQGSYINKNGGIVFTYGAQTPEIVCSVLQITDIELEPGEIINSVNIGDSTRWDVEPAMTGAGSSAIQHVLVKPLDINLQTSMLIATDKRAYRIKLKSTRTKYMSYVSFAYPEKINEEFNKKQAEIKAQRDRESIKVNPYESDVKTYLGDLNFRYEIKGDVSWKPVRVFDDGVKTIIEMPNQMLSRKAPALMLLNEEGGLFSDDKTEIVNYRLQGNRYIVDGIFDQAVLTMDLDSSQQRVVIKRK